MLIVMSILTAPFTAARDLGRCEGVIAGVAACALIAAILYFARRVSRG
jgi:cysteine synthase